MCTSAKRLGRLPCCTSSLRRVACCTEASKVDKGTRELVDMSLQPRATEPPRRSSATANPPAPCPPLRHTAAVRASFRCLAHVWLCYTCRHCRSNRRQTARQLDPKQTPCQCHQAQPSCPALAMRPLRRRARAPPPHPCYPWSPATLCQHQCPRSLIHPSTEDDCQKVF